MGRAEAPLVGRDAERTALDDALASAADGPVLLLLTGEAGIGKSRLCSELLDAATEQGWRALAGRAVPMSSGELPWAPWTEALRGLARREGRPALTRLVGDDAGALAPLLPLRSAGDERPPVAHVLEALLALVERLAEERPLALALEDLHWADVASLDALAFLVRNLADLPVLLVATARTDEGPGPLRAVLAELRRDVRARSLELGPLDPAGTAALAAALGASAADVERLHARSGGNPYYARELLAAGDRPVTHLQDAVLARLDGLPAAARRLLEALAVAGRPTGAALLAAVTDLPPDDVSEALRALDGRRLLGTSGAGHAPAHDLAATAVLSSLLPGERAELHGRFADALDRDPALLDDPRALLLARAEHRQGAGGGDGLLAAASAVVLADLGPAAVARWGRVALEQWDRVPGPADGRGEVLVRTAQALLDEGAPADAVRLLERSLAEPDAQDPQVAGDRLERLAQALWSDGRAPEAEAATERALHLLGDEPTAALARAQAGHASTLMVLGRWPAAEELARAGLRTAQAARADVQEAHLRATLGVVLVSSGRGQEGVCELERSVEQARATGDVRLLWRNLLNTSYGLEVTADAERAADVALQGLALARRHGRGVDDVRGAVVNAVSPLVDLGRWDEAQELLDAVPPGAPDDPRVRLLDRVAAALAVERGRPVADAALAGDDVEPRPRQQRDAVRAARALWAGDPVTARAALAASLDLEGTAVDRCRLLALDLRALADRLVLPAGAGGPGPAERTALLADLDRRLADLPAADGAEERVLVAQCRAEAARARGQEQPQDWAQVADGWDALRRPYSAALARWRLAAVLPDRASATAAARAAHGTAVRLGAEPLRRELELLAVRRRLALTGTSDVPRQAGPLDGLSLTGRERQVLELLSTGASNRLIGRQLHVSESTAGVHVSNVLRKLGVANRTEATAVAHRLGLAPTGGGER